MGVAIRCRSYQLLECELAPEETGKVPCVSLLERSLVVQLLVQLLLLCCAAVYIVEHLLSIVASQIT